MSITSPLHPKFCRRIDGKFGRPSAFHAVGQLALVNSGAAAPRIHVHGLPVDGNHVVVPLVRGLLKSRRPTHVSRLISDVVVDTVKRVNVTRACSNVRKEGGEIVAPFVTNRDAPSAVVLKLGVRRVETALANVVPRSVFRRPLSAGRSAMLQIARNDLVANVASARQRVAVKKVRGSRLNDSSAIAKASPDQMRSAEAISDVANSALNDKAFKPLSGDVFRVRMEFCQHALNISGRSRKAIGFKGLSTEARL